MVICKYFLQGSCKFGDFCKFAHLQLQDDTYDNNSSILLQNKTQPSTVETNTLVKAVVNDMTCVEKGAQWPLSSYAPFKEKPQFPGFDDYSPEEIRFLFYESAQNGNVEEYKQNLQVLLQQALTRVKSLQNPNNEAINILRSIYETTPTSSIFGSTQSTNFDSTSVFGDNSTFVVTNTNNFGRIQKKTDSSIFSTTILPPQQNSIFNTTGSSQGMNQTIFGGNNIFHQQVELDPFDGTQKSIDMTKKTFQNTPNIFNNSKTIEPHKVMVNPDFYSKLDELSEDEIKWCETDNFDLLEIPDKPPTYEMCFK